jgi:type II secretory pathway component GspD/PulD (secretin)
MLGGSGFSFSGLRYTNVDILISAMESTGDANVLSSPRIVTLNNQKAILKSIDRVYDVRTIQTTDANGLVTFSTELDPKEVGITLDVNPTIGQDGMISLGLDATVSRVMERRNYGVGTNVIIVNEISERKSNSRVMVRSGAPLVIGGLSSRDIRSNNQQVPILGSIPILGRLFRSDRKTATDLDLLIFLTARIVPPDGGVSEIETLLEQPRPVVPNPPPPVVETAPPVTRR